MPDYRLTYFDAMGRAEPIRLLFALSGVPYEDKRIALREWAALKKETPWGELPLLEVDGHTISHCRPIARFLARRFGVNGKDEWEEAQVDELNAGVDALLNKMQPWIEETNETNKILMLKKLIEEEIYPFLNTCEKFLEKKESDFFVGDKITIADLEVYHIISFLDKKIVPRQLCKFVKLYEFRIRIQDNPNIRKWLADRPRTDV